jgi:hypothetical protein
MGRRALVMVTTLLLTGVAAFAVFQFLNSASGSSVVTPSQSWAERLVQEIYLSDGTRCAVIADVDAGTGIDCDWSER